LDPNSYGDGVIEEQQWRKTAMTEDEEQQRLAEEETERAQQHLNAELASPNGSAPIAPPSMNLSEMGAMKELLGTLVLRVDQVARTSAEQFSRQERVNSETEKTMLLAREMIAEMSRQYDEMTDLIERTETAMEALVKVNANLTEIVAALLAPPQKA
jgi:hypothetical protein